MSTQKEKFIHWLDDLIGNGKVCDRNTAEFLRKFKKVYQANDALFADYRGKYFAIKNGCLMPLCFDSPSDIGQLRLKEYYGCFMLLIPNNERYCDTAQRFNSLSREIGHRNLQGGGSSFDEPRVDVELSTTEEGHKFRGSYMVDTGASDTSCPATKVDASSGGDFSQKRTLWDWLPCFKKDIRESVSVPYWGSNDGVSSTVPISVSTANGSITAQRAYLEKSFLNMKVGSLQPIDVNHLLLDDSVDSLLLGRDILLKHFTTTFSRAQNGNDGLMTLTEREGLSQPSSPGISPTFATVSSRVSKLFSSGTNNKTTTDWKIEHLLFGNN